MTYAGTGLCMESAPRSRTRAGGGRTDGGGMVNRLSYIAFYAAQVTLYAR